MAIYLAFADETNYNKGRYKGIGLISVASEDASALSGNLSKILVESNVSEAKWSNLNSAKARFAAQKMLDLTVKAVIEGILRVDVLTWDIEDSRHNLLSRDDIANLQRMYYHLFKNVLVNRYPDGCIWQLHPDENLAMKWGRLLFFLQKSGIKKPTSGPLSSEIILRIERNYNIHKIIPLRSCDEPLIQLADLFAGIAAYSRNNYCQYEQWICNGTYQQTLLESFGECKSSKSIKLSGSDKERCKLLDYFNKKCKRKKLGVSIKTNKGLKTFDPKKPINFWWYTPQHESDKAPTKEIL